MKIKSFKDTMKDIKHKQLINRSFYLLKSILGYWWAIFYFLLGGREAGKSYAVTSFYVDQFVRLGRPFYWLRLTESSAKKLLTNNAEKLIDPDIRRKYGLELMTNAENVYSIKRDKNGKIKSKILMCKVLAISTFYNDKGSGYFDAEFLDDPKMYYNICLDEMNREKSERNSFDIVYNFCNEIENLVRSTKCRIRVICIGNTLEEASDIMCAFNFLPEEFGRYKLVKNKKILVKYLQELKQCKDFRERAIVDKKYKSVDFGKRAVIEYMEPSEAYLERRKGTIADILMPTASTFTNTISTDNTLIVKTRLIKPNYIINFGVEKYTVWDNGVIAKYNGEKVYSIQMRPYLDGIFDISARDNIISMWDTRCYKFKNLVTFKQFKKQLELLKPRK